MYECVRLYVCLEDFMCLTGSICKLLLGSHASKFSPLTGFHFCCEQQTPIFRPKLFSPEITPTGRCKELSHPLYFGLS
jgi:hypothetical protein